MPNSQEQTESPQSPGGLPSDNTNNDTRKAGKDFQGNGISMETVGHGNGLGASSLQVGLSAHSDEEMLTAARSKLKNTKLGIYMIPGFGTIEDNLEPAIEIGVDLFKIGCHSTEADITKQHIEYLRGLNKEVYGVLMMSHMPSPERLRSWRIRESYVCGR